MWRVFTLEIQTEQSWMNAIICRIQTKRLAPEWLILLSGCPTNLTNAQGGGTPQGFQFVDSILHQESGFVTFFGRQFGLITQKLPENDRLVILRVNWLMFTT
jgi:hypothetical protein